MSDQEYSTDNEDTKIIGISIIPEVIDRPLRIAVLISGGGTTLTNILEHNEAGNLNIRVPIVIASKDDCAGIEKAKAVGLNTAVVKRSSYSSIDEFSKETFKLCRDAKVDLVVMGGYLALVRIPKDFHHRVLNIHPSLIPAFCGKGYHGHFVHEAVVKRGVKLTGCTVHFADNEYDHGPILLQKTVAVKAGQTPDQVAQNVFKAECEAYPEALQLFASGKLKIANGIVHIDE